MSAYIEKLESDSLDAICEVIGAPREYNSGKSAMRSWFLDRLRRDTPQPSQAVVDVIAERRRQIEVEGWTPEHDDGHTDGEIGRAAAAYAMSAMKRYQIPADLARDMKAIIAAIWPWGSADFKPTGKPNSVRRSLVKAGALILAEIERLDREAARAKDATDVA